MSRWRLAAIFIIILYLSANVLLIFNQPSSIYDSSCNCHSTTTPSTIITSSIIKTLSSTPSEAPSTHPNTTSSTIKKEDSNTFSTTTKRHKLAVLVPFRDRWEELMLFIPYMFKYLTNQNVSHEIWVINQVDKHRFNRAMLMNTGYVLTNSCCDYLVMHDVDLLPRSMQLDYSYPRASPFHISAPELHPLYHYKKYIGGILMMTREDFKKVNGLTNIFWGWGREDDELYLRIKEAGLQIHRPVGVETGNQTFIHNHDRKRRPRDMKSYGSQWKLSRRRDRESGLHSLKFHVVSVVAMTIDGAPVKIANVELHCDYQKTPFCDHQNES